MAFPKIPHSKSDPGGQQYKQERPQFNSHVTSDRLRESSMLPMASNIRKGRKSIFKEVGLSDEENEEQQRDSAGSEEKEFGEMTDAIPASTFRSESRASIEDRDGSKGRVRWLTRLAPSRRPRIKSASSAPPPSTVAGLSRFTMIALLIAIVLPALRYNTGRQTVELSGADAGVIRKLTDPVLETRQDSPTDVCTRWAGQSAILNGTMYIYGGRSKTQGDQTSDTWNNDLIAVDLTSSWDTSAPALTGLPQPSGPPAVSLGYLWNDYNHLFLYGGQFSDNPPESPVPVSTWQYDVSSGTWTAFEDPRTSAGNFSDPEGQPIQRASEGAGLSVPELGVSWYFGGHLDMYTTPGWSNQVERVYLRSLLEFTHPGYSNNGVDSLQASGAPDGGVYRNITWGGIQNQDGFTERADGVLVYVPGWGPNGILLGLGGGVVGDHETTDAFSSMSTIDVYDIMTSTWYHQETTGEAPQVRVNPCAVIFSAPDASSFNIYMYGGQNLLPFGEQTQYTDIWILTVPAFVWVRAEPNSDNEPPARAGHHCAARDGQMVVVGGYVGTDIPCDDPGVYAFDASNLQWQTSFNAADHPADDHPENSVLAGSYNYKVPEAVQSVVGGNADGGATATTPVGGPATDGPFATGTPPVFTVTAAGSTATVTNGPSGPGSAGAGGTGPGTIAAAVVAALAGLAALYLGFCAWLYRRQVKAYKRHMAVANRYSNGPEADDTAALAGAAGGMREKLRKAKGRPNSSSDGSGAGGAEQYGWVGQGAGGSNLAEPKWMLGSEDVSPGSAAGTTGTGTGSGSGRPSIPRPSEDRSPWGGGYDSGYGGSGVGRNKSSATRSTASGSSAEGLLDGREPNFFNVVLGPRRALRVVNTMED